MTPTPDKNVPDDSVRGTRETAPSTGEQLKDFAGASSSVTMPDEIESSTLPFGTHTTRVAADTTSAPLMSSNPDPIEPGKGQFDRESNASTKVKTSVQSEIASSPTDNEPGVEDLDQAVLAESRRHTRRDFVIAAAAAAAGYSLYDWIDTLPSRERQPAGYRRLFEANQTLSKRIFDERALSPTYPLKRAENLRVNGVFGLKMMMEPESYRLQLVGAAHSPNDHRFTSDVTAWEYKYIDEHSSEDQGHDTKTPPLSAKTAEKMAPKEMLELAKKREERTGRAFRGKEEAGESWSTLSAGTPGLLLTMDDVLKLPRHELVTQFKCIEGWSQIVHWAGVRMADFLEAYPPKPVDGREPGFVYMETPDGDYYCSYEMDICRHPQTLLVTEMMGAPLTQYHGAPLRLHMPTKYGYKQIKRIALISYTNQRPDDYWTKLGYDWYAGL